MALYLIGTDHDIQHDGKVNRLPRDRASEIRKEFAEYIARIADQNHVELIAEECCADILVTYGATTSMPKLAAEAVNIRHAYVDPGNEDRRRLGIPDHNYSAYPEAKKQEIYCIREKYWMERIAETRCSKVLLICGVLHVSRLMESPKPIGFDCRVVEKYWGSEHLPPTPRQTT